MIFLNGVPYLTDTRLWRGNVTNQQEEEDRLGKGNLEWTAAKLLLGAGAGADPTEIDVPAGGTTFAALTDVEVVRKTGDQTVNNSIAMVNDTELFFAVAANEVWLVTAFLHFRSGSTPDIRFAWTVPTNGVFRWGSLITFWGDVTPIALLTTDVLTVPCGGFTPSQGVVFLGIYIGGNTAGTLQLLWAQNTANVSDTTVWSNSCLIAHKLA